MSATPANPDPHANETPKSSFHPVWLLIIALFLWYVIKSIAPSWGNGDDHNPVPSSESNGTTVINYTAPARDPIVFTIDSSLSERIPIPDNYDYSFDCDQPYEVVNKLGEKVKSEANKSAVLGYVNVKESTKNKLLRFHTTNNTTATMTITFTPIPVQKN